MSRPNLSSPVRYVLSSEGFSGDHDRGYDNTAVVAECVHRMVDGHAADIIVYLRRQDDFVESLYTLSIKKGRSLSFDEYLARFDTRAFDWALLLERYAAAFGRRSLKVRRYHRAFLPSADSLLDDFGALIGCPELSAGRSHEPRNPGISRDALELARLANRHLEEDEQRQLRDILQRTNAKPAFQHFGFFAPGQRAEFLARYTTSNAAVAREYFADESGELFPPDAEGDDDVPYEGLTLERAAVIVARALLQLRQSAERQSTSASAGGHILRRLRQVIDRVRPR